jgi:hypothetical protein
MATPVPPLLTDPLLTEVRGIRHAFFTRQGGVSEGIYASLNVGYGSDDERVAVTENRRRAMAAFGLPAESLNTVYQVHGTDVAVAERNWDPLAPPKADAMVTDRPGIVIGILTADCVPVLFVGETAAGGRVVGAAHAGWRGAVSGILDSTVSAMEELGCRRAAVRAAVGPCIGQDSYEVGPEFPAPFLEEDRGNERFFRPGRREGHPMFDIAGYVESRLRRAGIAAIGRIEADTCADAGRFFSYRRKTLTGEPDYGRELSAIAIEG